MKLVKRMTIRKFRRRMRKETLGPIQALRVKKARGKESLVVRRTDTVDLGALHEDIMREIPLTGPSQKTDLAAWHQEGEER